MAFSPRGTIWSIVITSLTGSEEIANRMIPASRWNERGLPAVVKP